MGEERPARKHRRRVVALVSGFLVLALLTVVMMPNSSPVGHWDGREGHERFVRAYTEAFQEMPEPEETLDVRTDHGIVRVHRFAGSTDREHPLVLLPGRASASPVWADNLPSLLEVGDVYTIDLLGEPGMSVQERPIEDDEDQASWLHQTLRALPEDGFHLVGLSIGGWTAVNLALRRPEPVVGLITIDPVFVFADIPLGTVVRSLPATLPRLPRSWRDGFNSWTAGGAPVEDEPVAEMIEAGMQHYTLRLPQPTRIGEEELAGLDVPVLAIIAEESVMHDAASAVEVAERALPEDATVNLYPGASHAVNGEHPHRIAADIADFLSERG